MKKTKPSNGKLAAALAGAALLAFAGAASAQLTVSTAAQYGPLTEYPGVSAPFTPTWTLPANNLIAGLLPSFEQGAISLDNSNRDLSSLTSVTSDAGLAIGSVAGNQGPDPIGNATATSNYLTFGNGATAVDYGDQLIYTLPAAAYGYNLTNIEVYGGWQDGGRCSQDYTVLYSTVAHPNSFIYLTNVSYQASPPSGNAASTQVILSQSGGGVIASNVAAVEFDFTCPSSENGWVGYAAIFLQGPAASTLSLPTVSVTTSNEQAADLTPTWVPDTQNDLILGLSPSGTNGNLNADGNMGPVSVLTDGLLATNIVEAGANTWESQCVSLGANAGTELIYTLPANANGYNVTNIAVYNTWQDEGRDGQYYTVSYSTVAAPSSYIPITTVFLNPGGDLTPSANQVLINNPNGAALASSVQNIKFDFASPNGASQFNNGWSGYDQIVVQGTPTAAPPPPPSPYLTQDALPLHAETVVGDQVVFTAAYSNFPPVILQWQQITTSPAATNDVAAGVVNVTNNGIVASTLILNDVQLGSSGAYRLMGVNATNSGAAPSFSSAVSLTVSNAPVMGNVIMDYAVQDGPAGFYPSWTINTNADLIFGSPTDGSGNPGTATAGPGNYANQTGLDGDPTILADGNLSDSLSNMVSLGWVNVGAGQSMTYTLPVSAHGYDITNITVYGGWPDDGRNEQKYQILYSTPSAPTTFASIGTFDYNPALSDAQPNATRVTLVPVSGALAQNVYALEFNFNMQSKNNWNGYSEITVGGTPSVGVIPALVQDITPLTAEDVVGSSLVVTGAFTGATSYQWQKNGTNIPGATSSSLVLNNLQLTDTATNGGYRLLGINAAGTNATRGCSVIVDADPAPVGNVITAFAYQTSDSSTPPPNSFGPTWTTADLTNSLIYQQDPPSIGYGTGNFNDPDVNFPNSAGGLPVLTDGSYGAFAFDGSHPAFATCGPDAGQYVIYSLGANTNGYTITNIQIAGGWNDNGRNSQYYTVSYSTVANPTVYIPINAVSISPTFSGESVIRTTMTAASGALATNAYALYVDFTQPPGVPNGYSGYSEISVFGSPSATQQVAPPPGTVNNPSFELNVTAPGTAETTVPTYWTAFNEGGSSDIGSQNAGGTDYTTHDPLAPPAAGNQYCYINMFDPSVTGGIYQDTGELQSNTTYTLTVAIGSRADRINSPGIISLINGTDNTGTVLATGGGLPATQNTWQDYSVSYTTGPSVSGDLTVELSVLGNATTIQADFDNVRLTTGAKLPTLGVPRIAGGQLIVTGTGGVPNSGYTWLSTTNLAPPIVWTTNSTGTLDGTGSFSNTIPVNASQKAGFLRLRQP